MWCTFLLIRTFFIANNHIFTLEVHNFVYVEYGVVIGRIGVLEWAIVILEEDFIEEVPFIICCFDCVNILELVLFVDLK